VRKLTQLHKIDNAAAERVELMEARLAGWGGEVESWAGGRGGGTSRGEKKFPPPSENRDGEE
jgi:hypothetical protein